jgi:hypothetical protein
MPRRFRQVDVFSDRLGYGNPSAVASDADETVVVRACTPGTRAARPELGRAARGQPISSMAFGSIFFTFSSINVLFPSDFTTTIECR